MASEITMVGELKFLKGTLQANIPRITSLITMAGTRFTGGVQDIGFAAHEAIALLSDQSTVGVCMFINTDGTNYVEIGIQDGSTFEPTIKLTAGQFALFPAATAALYAKANTASVKLQKLLIEP